MSLTELAIRRATARDKPYKLFDSGGLFMLVAPTGGKWWRLKFRVARKEKLISLGVYPEVSLKTARERRDDERRKLASGIDPAASRLAKKMAPAEQSADNFEIIAREWIEEKTTGWSRGTKIKTLRRLELDVFPWLRNRTIVSITTPELLAILRRVEARGALDTAHRVWQSLGQIFRFAIVTGRAQQDPTRDLRDALKPVRGGHFAAVVDPKAIGPLLRSLSDYRGGAVVRCALRFAPLVFVRPGEMRHAKWAEIDFQNAEWSIPAERMKMRVAHLVPLSSQAVDVLKELHQFTGRGSYLFPSPRSDKRPMSDNAVLSAMRSLGITQEQMCGHGFRAMARTVLDEVLGFRPDVIEHQLAHTVKDSNGRAYNRTSHLPYRRTMMQKWADYLDELRNSPKV